MSDTWDMGRGNKWKSIHWFKRWEFDSPDAIGTGAGIDSRLVWILDNIRDEVNEALVITSGVRTVNHNTEAGGVTDSSHLATKGYAVDVTGLRGMRPELRFRLIKAAILHGIHRIGIHNDFIHLDIDPSKPPGVAWLYDT